MSSAPSRPAPKQPTNGHKGTAHCSVDLNRLDRELRTGWREAAGGWAPGADLALVGADGRDEPVRDPSAAGRDAGAGVPDERGHQLGGGKQCEDETVAVEALA